MKINGVYTAQPVSMQIILSDLDNESTRDPLGNMYRDRINVKRKINNEWGILTTQEISQILQLTANVFFNVTYTDPYSGTEETRVFYAGDRTAPIAVVVNGETFWRGLTCNFIEK